MNLQVGPGISEKDVEKFGLIPITLKVCLRSHRLARDWCLETKELTFDERYQPRGHCPGCNQKGDTRNLK
jgi:hypothetical protein